MTEKRLNEIKELWSDGSMWRIVSRDVGRELIEEVSRLRAEVARFEAYNDPLRNQRLCTGCGRVKYIPSELVADDAINS